MVVVLLVGVVVVSQTTSLYAVGVIALVMTSNGGGAVVVAGNGVFSLLVITGLVLETLAGPRGDVRLVCCVSAFKAAAPGETEKRQVTTTSPLNR